MVMKKAIDEVRKYTSSRQINNALNTWNGPSTTFVHDLLIISLVLMYQESNASQTRKWKGLYNLLNMQGKLVIIELSHGLKKFRNILVKPYFINSTSIDNQ